MAPGSNIQFVDNKGKEHNALVLHVWETTLNIIYVEPNESQRQPEEAGDSCGNRRIIETSVPWFEDGMDSFYVKKSGA